MPEPPETPAPKAEPARPPDRPGRAWAKAAALGLALFLIYVANGREIGTYDTIPTTMLAINLARGEGIHLDRFGHDYAGPDGSLPPFLTRARGHVVSLYPVGPAVVAAPLVWVQGLALDRWRPGWDVEPRFALAFGTLLVKNAAAALAAIAAMFLYRALGLMGLGRAALPATIAAALGSDLWAVGSQALWQHGPAALMLSMTLWLLAPERPSGGRFLLAGLAMATLVACRAIDLPFAAIALAWVVRYHPRRLPWFLPAPLVIAPLLIGYNYSYFGTLSGGQAILEAMHPEVHGVAGPWAGDLFEGAMGTLLSPNRGLFVFCPWVPLALAAAPWSLRQLRRRSLATWLLAGLIVYMVMLSKYAVWWAGHTFGPRYWTDVGPLFAVLLAAALTGPAARRRILAAPFGLAIALSIAIQAIGAFCYPSSWNLRPVNVDRRHERLWDWSDTELSRCVIETLNAPDRRGR